MLNPAHVRALVVRPTLEAMEMWSPAAEELLMGTAMQESHLRHLHQLGAGPAVGLYQMEPATAHDIVHRYLLTRSGIEARFESAFQVVNSHDIDWREVAIEAVAMKLISDLRFATAMCRMRYFMVPAPLPAADDVPGLAAYWKRHYNTPAGRGTVDEWVTNYRRLRAEEGCARRRNDADTEARELVHQGAPDGR